MTFFSVPRAAVTAMPSDGLTSATPFAGVIFTAEAATAALALALAAGLTWRVLCPLPEHPAPSSASASTAETLASCLSRRTCVPSPCRIVIRSMARMSALAFRTCLSSTEDARVRVVIPFQPYHFPMRTSMGLSDHKR